MSCTCMTDIETKIVSDQPFTGLVVKEAKFDKTLIFGKDTLVSRPVIEIELDCDGRKHPVRKSMTYGFCPFCGEAYDPLPESPFEEEKKGDKENG